MVGSANTEPLPYSVRSDDFEDGDNSKTFCDSGDNYDDEDGNKYKWNLWYC